MTTTQMDESPEVLDDLYADDETQVEDALVEDALVEAPAEPEVTPVEDTEDEPEEPVTDWRAALRESVSLSEEAGKVNRRASTLLWRGAKAAIEEWLPHADADKKAETLYQDIVQAMGVSRKGDASKIATVARAVVRKGLSLDDYPSLRQAYNEASRLLKTTKEQKAEDKALTTAVQDVAESAPKTATTPEAAAKVLMREGPEKAVGYILDAIGAENLEAHRAFARAVSGVVAARAAGVKKAQKEAERKQREAEKAEARKAAATAAKAQPKPGSGAAKKKKKKAKSAPETKAAEKPGTGTGKKVAKKRVVRRGNL